MININAFSRCQCSIVNVCVTAINVDAVMSMSTSSQVNATATVCVTPSKHEQKYLSITVTVQRRRNVAQRFLWTFGSAVIAILPLVPLDELCIAGITIASIIPAYCN